MIAVMTTVASDNPLATLTLVVQSLMALSFLIGGGLFLVRLGKIMGAFEQHSKYQTEQITEIKNDVKAQGAVLITVAVQKEELTSLRRDLTRVQDTITDMQRGKGYIINDREPAAPERR